MPINWLMAVADGGAAGRGTVMCPAQVCWVASTLGASKVDNQWMGLGLSRGAARPW